MRGGGAAGPWGSGREGAAGGGGGAGGAGVGARQRAESWAQPSAQQPELSPDLSQGSWMGRALVRGGQVLQWEPFYLAIVAGAATALFALTISAGHEDHTVFGVALGGPADPRGGR